MPKAATHNSIQVLREPVVPRQLVKHNPPELPAKVGGEFDSVMSFFTLKGLDLGLKATNWTIEQELRVLTEIALDKDEESTTRMGAVKMIRDHLKEGLILEGGIQQMSARRVRNVDGAEVVETVEQMGLRGLADQTRHALDQADTAIKVLETQANKEEEPDGQDETSPTPDPAAGPDDCGPVPGDAGGTGPAE